MNAKNTVSMTGAALALAVAGLFVSLQAYVDPFTLRVIK